MRYLRGFSILLAAFAITACQAGTASVPAETAAPPTGTPVAASQPEPTGTATLAATATPEPGGYLLFGSAREISVYDLATGQTSPFLRGLDSISGWSLSPDGRRVVYTLDPPLDAQTYAVDLEAGQIRPIRSFIPELAWHPSGEAFIGFHRETKDTGRVELYRITDDLIAATIYTGVGLGIHAWSQHFSPDGTRLMRACGDESLCLNDILMNAAGQVTGFSSTPRKIRLPESLGIHFDSVQWSPGGDLLAFEATKASSRFSNADHIVIVKSDGSGYADLFDPAALRLGKDTILTGAAFNAIGQRYGFSWSPDGSKIAFAVYGRPADSESWSPTQVFVVNSDGSGMTRITGEEGFWSGTNPLWTPDGRILFLAVEKPADSMNVLAIANPDGSGRQVLGPGVNNYYRFLPPEAPDYLGRVIVEPFVFTCATGWTRLAAGRQARVAGMVADPPNRVRSEPKLGDNLLAQIQPGSVVTVREGPVCADGLVFWKVEAAGIPGGSGWMAEGDGAEYWMEPERG
ncbi:MAG: hypothetical protein WBM17_08945 [Anaerolineales bacterium]